MMVEQNGGSWITDFIKSRTFLKFLTFVLCKSLILFYKKWRPRPESNRSRRICNPLRSHSATRPHIRSETLVKKLALCLSFKWLSLQQIKLACLLSVRCRHITNLRRLHNAF